MYIVRPASIIDLPGIERLLNNYEIRVTTLPSERDKLGELLHLSTKSFNKELDNPRESTFIFVLENKETGELAGVSGIDAYAGVGYPFFNYRMEELIHASHHLGVHTTAEILYLSHELTGSSVLRSFAIKPELRNTVYFDLLSRARFMYMAQDIELFSDNSVTEIQGDLNEDGDSDFWNSIGKHFFDIDFATADYYVGVKSKTFIAELMPQHPIYVSLLSNSARDSMNKAHPITEQTCQLLFREGFDKSQFIDIFDGGPVLKTKTRNIQTIANCKLKETLVSDLVGGLKYLISNNEHGKFRCGIGNLVDGIGDNIRLETNLAKDLNVSNGDSIRYSFL